jgi:hypothetical protein
MRPVYRTPFLSGRGGGLRRTPKNVCQREIIASWLPRPAKIATTFEPTHPISPALRTTEELSGHVLDYKANNDIYRSFL